MRQVPTARQPYRNLRRHLRRWFQRNGRSLPWREPGADAYVRVVSEVLLQRTHAETVAAMLPAFLRAYPSWRVLALGQEADLEKLLQSIGLWRRRAKSLLALARRLAAEDFIFPSRENDLLQWPAIGPYVASAVLMFVHRHPSALIDEGVARLLPRAFGCRSRVDIRHDHQLRKLAADICSSPNAVALNWAILDVVAKHCRAGRPTCGGCPIAADCLYLRAQTMA